MKNPARPPEFLGRITGRSAGTFITVSNYGNRQGRMQRPERRGASTLTNTKH
jgi:hypothetical protein